MKPVVIAMPGNERLADELATYLGLERGAARPRCGAFVPATVVSQKYALEDMHDVVPKDGGQIHHLVVALFNSNGTRIEDAVVRAQLSETGIVDVPPKYLTPMSVDGQMTYGHLFSTVRGGPYRFRVLVKLTSRAAEIEFAVSAWSPHREVR